MNLIAVLMQLFAGSMNCGHQEIDRFTRLDVIVAPVRGGVAYFEIKTGKLGYSLLRDTVVLGQDYSSQDSLVKSWGGHVNLVRCVDSQALSLLQKALLDTLFREATNGAKRVRNGHKLTSLLRSIDSLGTKVPTDIDSLRSSVGSLRVRFLPE